MSYNITGLFHVTGEHDTGKTLFGLTLSQHADIPLKRFAFVDADIKGRATVRSIGMENFGLYYDYVEMCKGKREIEQHETVLKIIKEIEQHAAEIDVVIWDTWTDAGKTCHAYVKKYPDKFRESYAPSGVIKGAEIGAEGNRYESELIDRLVSSIPIVIFTTHLRDQRKQVSEGKSALTGKMEPDARKAIEKNANFRVWLRHNPDGTPLPIGLVLKRPTKFVLVDGKLQAINILPRKLKPCTWERINYYWENPIGDRVPSPDEMPDAFELSILDGTLTPDQKMLFEASLKAVEEEPTEPVIAPTTEKVLSLPERIKAERERHNGNQS